MYRLSGRFPVESSMVDGGNESGHVFAGVVEVETDSETTSAAGNAESVQPPLSKLVPRSRDTIAESVGSIPSWASNEFARPTLWAWMASIPTSSNNRNRLFKIQVGPATEPDHWRNL